MARKKQPLSEFLMSAQNLYNVHNYFSRLISEGKIFRHEKDWEKQDAAKEEFKRLSLDTDNNKGTLQKFCRWIETYLSDEQWERCKTAIRQKKLAKKRKYKFKSYRLPIGTCNKLTYYAETKGLSKVQALTKLIEAAYNKC